MSTLLELDDLIGLRMIQCGDTLVDPVLGKIDFGGIGDKFGAAVCDW